jgi:hypothetical protein
MREAAESRQPYTRRIREALMASEQVTELSDSKGKVRGSRWRHCWQVYATVAEVDECRTKHGNRLTD